MNRFFILISLFIGCVISIYAQEYDPEKRDKMFKEVREFKMKYLAQEMELSENQKPKFFVLYEEMSASRDSCYRHVRGMEKNLKRDKDVTEEDYHQVTEAMTDANSKYAEIEKIYDAKFSEFLSPKQIYKMKEAEQNFRSKLEGMRQERRKGRMKNKR